MIYYKGTTKIVLKESVLRTFEMYKQTGRKHERGGIVLGKVKKNKIVLTRASIPTGYDWGNRTSFVRHKMSGQLFTDYEFLNSNGKVIYLGEWHTHPEDHPTPSSTDKKMIAKQFNRNDINEEFLFMIIIGRRSIYVGYYDGKTLTELLSK